GIDALQARTDSKSESESLQSSGKSISQKSESDQSKDKMGEGRQGQRYAIPQTAEDKQSRHRHEEEPEQRKKRKSEGSFEFSRPADPSRLRAMHIEDRLFDDWVENLIDKTRDPFLTGVVDIGGGQSRLKFRRV